MLDDKVQAGYEADQRNDFVASGMIWLDAWSDALRQCDAVGCGCRKPAPPGQMLCRSWLARFRGRMGGQVLVRPEVG